MVNTWIHSSKFIGQQQPPPYVSSNWIYNKMTYFIRSDLHCTEIQPFSFSLIRKIKCNLIPRLSRLLSRDQTEDSWGSAGPFFIVSALNTTSSSSARRSCIIKLV